jgi:hypothetical protein
VRTDQQAVRGPRERRRQAGERAEELRGHRGLRARRYERKGWKPKRA